MNEIRLFKKHSKCICLISRQIFIVYKIKKINRLKIGNYIIISSSKIRNDEFHWKYRATFFFFLFPLIITLPTSPITTSLRNIDKVDNELPSVTKMDFMKKKKKKKDLILPSKLIFCDKSPGCNLTNEDSHPEPRDTHTLMLLSQMVCSCLNSSVFQFHA